VTEGLEECVKKDARGVGVRKKRCACRMEDMDFEWVWDFEDLLVLLCLLLDVTDLLRDVL